MAGHWSTMFDIGDMIIFRVSFIVQKAFICMSVEEILLDVLEVYINVNKIWMDDDIFPMDLC